MLINHNIIVWWCEEIYFYNYFEKNNNLGFYSYWNNDDSDKITGDD